MQLSEANPKGLGDARKAGGLLLVGGAVNVLFNMIGEGTYPGYFVGDRALSDMGAIGAPTFLLWNGQLLVTGIVSLVAIGLFLRSRALRIPNMKLAYAFYGLPPIGAIVVSLFPENSIPAMHAIGAFMVFILGGLGMLYAYTFTRRPLREASFLLGVVSLVSIGLFWVPSLISFGVSERLVVYSYNIWTVMFAGYLMAIA